MLSSSLQIFFDVRVTFKTIAVSKNCEKNKKYQIIQTDDL